MVFRSSGITFRTLSEIRREEGLPTVDDLRRQYPRSLFTAEEAVAAFKAAQAAAALAAAEAAAVAEAAASAEAEELENKCENLNPCASRAGTESKRKGKSIPKDLGESSKTENLSTAGASSACKDEHYNDEVGFESKEMAFTSRAITFRTLSEIRREEGLPTVDDLRRQYPRSLSEEAVAAFKAAQAAAALAAAEAAAAAVIAEAEEEELEIKCENLNPSASTTGTEPKLKGKSVSKDLGESSKTENLSPAGASFFEDKQKTLDIESACMLLDLVLGPNYRSQVDSFVEFLKIQKEYSDKHGSVDKLFAFLSREFSDLQKYDACQAWPLILDNFVEWLREKSTSA